MLETLCWEAKPEGSVKLRVKILKLLIDQKRIKISANCKGVIRMLKDLKKGKSRLNFVVSDENKHLFDALTYPLMVLCAEELKSFEERIQLGVRMPAGIVVQT